MGGEIRKQPGLAGVYDPVHWSGVYVGLFTATASTHAPQEFNDVTMQIDTLDADRILGAWGCHEERQGRASSDGTIDEELFSDDFDSNSVTLSYDDTLDLAGLRQGQSGNMTFDGGHSFVYDGWNP